MKIKILFLAVIACNALIVKSQVSIIGPSCVVAGIQYQYIINTTDTSGSGIHICVIGGSLNSGDSCLNDTLISAVYVTWHAGATNLSVSFNSGAGSASNTIYLTTALQAGLIDAAYAEQTISYNAAIPTITCSVATGGSCSPGYVYQWQKSVDNVTWVNIENATNLDFDAGITITQTTYLRRKVTETASSSIGYSSIAAMYVVAPPSAADTTGYAGNKIHFDSTGTPKNENILAAPVAINRDIKESTTNSL